MCFGRLDPPKNPDFFFWRVWAGFLPLASYLISGTVLKSERQQPEFGLSGFAFNAKSKSAEFFCCLSLLDPRLEARGTASALARGRSRDSRLATRDSRLATCGSQRLSKVLDSTRRHGTGLAETLTRLDGTTTELDSRLTRFATRRTARRLADSTRLDSSSTAWPRHKSLVTTQPGGEVPCRFLKYACLLQTATRIYPSII